jgi:hypothetical protein
VGSEAHRDGDQLTARLIMLCGLRRSSGRHGAVLGRLRGLRRQVRRRLRPVCLPGAGRAGCKDRWRGQLPGVLS